MSETMPDPDDHCAVCTWLRGKLNKILAGEAILEIEFLTGAGSGRRLKKVPPNINALREAIAVEDAACAKQTGATPRRFAILGGTHRWPR